MILFTCYSYLYLQGSAKGGAGEHFGHGLLNLVYFGLGKTFDGAKALLRHHLSAFDGADADALQLLQVGYVDAVVLQQLYVLEEGFVFLVFVRLHGNGGGVDDLLGDFLVSAEGFRRGQHDVGDARE